MSFSGASASVCAVWLMVGNGEPTGLPLASFNRRVTTTAYVVRCRSGVKGRKISVLVSRSYQYISASARPGRSVAVGVRPGR